MVVMGGRLKTSSKFFLLAVLGLGLLGSGCTHIYTAHGAYYRVRPGDTLDDIAKKHRVGVQDLAEVNNILQTSDLKPGKSLYIPGATPSSFAAILKKEGISVRREGSKKETKNEVASSAEGGEPSGEEIAEAGSSVKTDRYRFAWPIQGDISSLFGMRRGRRHDGLDIRSRPGTPVGAAADGEVVFSKRMRGYGNLILVKHKNDFFTVYAHNSVNLAKVGAKVKKGQIIAKVGRTGRASGPHLHFEVREGAKARNPLFFLPRTDFAQKAHERNAAATGGPEGESDGEMEAENP